MAWGVVLMSTHYDDTSRTDVNVHLDTTVCNGPAPHRPHEANMRPQPQTHSKIRDITPMGGRCDIYALRQNIKVAVRRRGEDRIFDCRSYPDESDQKNGTENRQKYNEQQTKQKEVQN